MLEMDTLIGLRFVKEGSPHVGVQVRMVRCFSGQLLDDGHGIDAAPVGRQDVLDEVVAEEEATRLSHAPEFPHGRLQLRPVALDVDVARFEPVTGLHHLLLSLTSEMNII